MKDISIRQKVMASFGLMLLVMLTVGVFGYIRLEEIEAEARTVDSEAVPGLYNSALIKDALSDSYALTSQHVLQRSLGERGANEAALQRNRAELSRLVDRYAASIAATTERQTFDTLRTALGDYSAAQEALLAAASAGEGSDAAARAIDDRLYPRFRTALAAARALSAKNHDQGLDAAGRVHDDLLALQNALVVATAIALLVALLGGSLLLRAIDRPLTRLMSLMDVMREGDFTQRMAVERRDEFGALAEGFNRMAEEVMNLVGQVQKSGIRVSTSMTEIAATSKQQQATASEVAATTTEIGATSREISATSKELVRTMNEVASVAEHAAELASSGQSGLVSMEETMRQVMDAAGSINAKLAVLNEKAGNINQVVTTITKVADQTNLLSLNAAIEAEKAGEYGRGFSVVSTEIRRLADQTAVATLDIEEMVKEIQSAVAAGVMGMDKFSEEVRRGMRDVQDVGGKLSHVIAQVQALVPRFETVNDGMQAQATGAEQISEALLQLTETTRQTVEALRQSNAAIEELNQVSGSLHGSITRFKLAA